jgi:hypothetical protein
MSDHELEIATWLGGRRRPSVMPGKTINILWATQPPRSGPAIAPDRRLVTGGLVRISRVRLHDFRGWADLDLRPRTHMLLAGVPRAGRSDIIVALTRLLDPAFIRVQPTLADVRQQRAGAATGDGAGATTIDNRDADDEDDGATTGCNGWPPPCSGSSRTA